MKVLLSNASQIVAHINFRADNAFITYCISIIYKIFDSIGKIITKTTAILDLLGSLMRFTNKSNQN